MKRRSQTSKPCSYIAITQSFDKLERVPIGIHMTITCIEFVEESEVFFLSFVTENASGKKSCHQVRHSD